MFLRCDQCGNLFMSIEDSGNPVVCCGEVMRILTPDTMEGDTGDKHIPVYELYDKKLDVKIGSTMHPSTKEHYIKWICLETEKGIQIRYLKPGDEPTACFKVCRKEKLLTIYSFCNIHGLWAYKFTNADLKEDCGNEKST